MLEEGLEDEARRLWPLRHLNALNTVGYKELFDYFEGKTDYAEAVRLIKRNSRRYARKQLSWFRRDDDIRWFHPDDRGDSVNENRVDVLTEFNDMNISHETIYRRIRLDAN